MEPILEQMCDYGKASDVLVIHELTPEQVGTDLFGWVAADVGDLNGDAAHEFIITAPFYSDTAASQGKAYLYSGLDGTLLQTFLGEENDWLGYSAASAGDVNDDGSVGDVNGDGVPDAAVAARHANNGAGQAYVLSGSDGAWLRTMNPVTPSNSLTFGRFFADEAGDVNNDGIPDVYIGDYAANDGDGRVYIFSGAEDAELLYLFDSEMPGDGLGPGRAIGDVNGDDHDDLIVAAWSSSAGGAPAAGKVYIYSGADGSILHTATGTTAEYYLGVDALGVGDVNLDGEPDYLVTGYAQPSYVISFVESPTAVTLDRVTAQGTQPSRLPLTLVGLVGLSAAGMVGWRRRRKGNERD
ncbi:MAG: VCBS repeat-containing protein [Chloroflexota bacterium]|nr:VCBS repeat-containing protein [Chloroflexota bacterium]